MPFIYINKPKDWTSHDVVSFLRKKIKAMKPENKSVKVGHAGTLDPFATGLLIVGIGRDSTKKLDEFKKLPKTYTATLRLGAVSDTHDIMGEIRHTVNPEPPTSDHIAETLKSFLGRQMQTPPMFSAKKIGGKKLYELARKGITVERQPAAVEIYRIELLDYVWPYLKIEVQCSAGTYIRSLADDIGKKLGIGAFCAQLERTAIGPYLSSQAKNPEDFDPAEITQY
jgi:tRNA pseudouridine55 synthase